MEEATQNDRELRRIIRMLEKTVEMAKDPMLTGEQKSGQFAVRSYNAVLEHLSSTGEVAASLFPSLPESAGIEDVGIASGQLAEYLQAGLPEAEQRSAELSGTKLGDHNVFFNIGGLSEIGDLIRENLAQWLGGKKSEPQAEEGRTERPESSEAAASSEPAAAARGNGDPQSSTQAASRPALPSQRARIEELRPERKQETAPQ